MLCVICNSEYFPNDDYNDDDDAYDNGDDGNDKGGKMVVVVRVKTVMMVTG